MLFNVELHEVISNEEINSLSLFYLISSSLNPIVCVRVVSKNKGSYATNSWTNLIKHTPTKQHCVNDDVNDQLRLLIKKFCDVFLDDFPSRLSP